jgi:hypothetical protein
MSPILFFSFTIEFVDDVGDVPQGSQRHQAKHDQHATPYPYRDDVSVN